MRAFLVLFHGLGTLLYGLPQWYNAKKATRLEREAELMLDVKLKFLPNVL